MEALIYKASPHIYAGGVQFEKGGQHWSDSLMPFSSPKGGNG